MLDFPSELRNVHSNLKACSLLEGESQGSALSGVPARVSFMVNTNRNNLWPESSRRLWDVHELQEEAGASRVSTGLPVNGRPEPETELSAEPRGETVSAAQGVGTCVPLVLEICSRAADAVPQEVRHSNKGTEREAGPQGVCTAEGPGGTLGTRALSSLPSFRKDCFIGANISSWPNLMFHTLSLLQIFYINTSLNL